MLRGLAWLVRLRLLPSLSPLAGLLHWGSRTFRWGEHRGGMFVEVEGRTLQLKGTAEEQYHEWRRLLKELYENETGLPVQTPAAAEPAAPAPNSGG